MALTVLFDGPLIVTVMAPAPEAFGDALLKAHPFVLIPSVVSTTCTEITPKGAGPFGGGGAGQEVGALSQQQREIISATHNLVRDRKTLLVYAKYDLTFPVDLSRRLVDEFASRGIPHEVAGLRCGHYTTGVTPFKFIDGWILSRFLRRALLN